MIDTDSIIIKSLCHFNIKILILLMMLAKFIVINLLVLISTDSVCDLELLILELKQDLEDNGILDCLR